MKSYIIAWKDFKIRFTDRRGFFLMIFFPIVLTAILGSALGGIMGNESLPKTSVGIVQTDQDPMGTIFVKDVLQGKEMKNLISVTKVDSENKLKSLLRDGKIDAGIVIPRNWSQNLQEKKATLITDPGKEMEGSIAETILQTFISRINTISASTKIVLTASAQALTPNEMKSLAGQLSVSLAEIANNYKYNVQEASVGKKQVSGMQYYAAAMAAMFLLFNVTNGAKSFINERDTETLARLMSTPTKKRTILTGKFLGNLYFVLAQFTIFLAVTRLLFHVNWGVNVAQTLLIGFTYSIAVSGLAMLFAALIKNVKTADMVGSLGVQVFSLLGGSMIPITIFPPALQTVANIAPNKWALSSLIDIMAGTSWSDLLTPITVLLMIGVVSLSIGTWRLQAK